MSRLTIVTFLIAALACGSLHAQETTTTTPTTSDEVLRHAAYLISVGDYAQARTTYMRILKEFPGTAAVDKAVVGIAKTHLGQEDYQGSINWLQDVLYKSQNQEARVEARELYTTLEKNFRNARTSAESFYQQKKAEYDDISWFNIFKIFKKLKLRSEVKKAEKDLQLISNLHNLFDPRLLVPADYEPAESTTTAETGTTTTTTESTTATTTTTATETASTEDMDKKRAYEVLKDEIAALVALIPAEKLSGETTATETASTTEETTEATTTESEATTETTTETAAAPETSETAEETEGKEEPDVVIGETSKPVDETESEAATEATTETVAETTSEEATAETTSEAATETSTEVAETAPAAPETSTPSAASLKDLRATYMSAYRAYHEALRTNDPKQISGALNRYRETLRAYQAEHANMMRHNNNIPTPGTNQGQGKPSDTGTEKPQAPTNSAPAGTGVNTQTGRTPAGTSAGQSNSGPTPNVPYYGPQGNVRTDRAGRAQPAGNSNIKVNRRSFHR